MEKKERESVGFPGAFVFFFRGPCPSLYFTPRLSPPPQYAPAKSPGDVKKRKRRRQMKMVSMRKQGKMSGAGPQTIDIADVRTLPNVSV